MGLPALCVGWGPISDAGYLTRNTSVRDSLEQRLGRPPLGAEQALGQLDEVLSRDAGVTSIANFDWNVLSRLLPSSEGTRFAWLNTFLRDNGQDEQIDFKTLIAGKSEDEVLELVTNLVLREIARTLCVDAASIDVHRSLHDMGMDSLMAVELAVGLEQRLGIQLPVMMLSDSPSVARVSARIVEKLLRAEGDDGPESERDFVLQGMIRQHGEDDVSKDQVEGLSDEVAELAQKGTSLIQ
jgi:acyl carrier protein